LPGETEISPNVIEDANDVQWTINDNTFYNNPNIYISVKDIKTGKLIKQQIITKNDYYSQDYYLDAARHLESMWSAKYNNDQIQINGFMLAGITDRKAWYSVYGNNEQPNYDNLEGENALYKIRFTYMGQVYDSALVFFFPHISSISRAQTAPAKAVFDIAQGGFELNAAFRAIKQIIQLMHN
jgi:hypothetical protein